MSLQLFRKSKTESLHRDVAALPNDEMVEHLDIERLPRRHQVYRDQDIRARRCGITRRVIVDKDDAHRVMPYSIAKDLCRPDAR